MQIQSLALRPYQVSLIHGQVCRGALLKIGDEQGRLGWGDVAPLPGWSSESLEDAISQFDQKKDTIAKISWSHPSLLQKLSELALLPSLCFGLESALLSLLDPLPAFSVPVSAFLKGSAKEILEQAALKFSEGYTSAKLKVGRLRFSEAEHVMHLLKDKFRLRIDVNRAWKTTDALAFFAPFPQDAFDYVEEPFQNPADLHLFSHPLAVDESFPRPLSLEQLATLPTLKALVYKPTLQGGLLGCLPLLKWAAQKGISLVLSSSFESDLGHAHIAAMAHRLQIPAPVGIGTYHCLNECICPPIHFSHGTATIPGDLAPFLDTI